jgi:hypothetical protein
MRICVPRTPADSGKALVGELELVRFPTGVETLGVDDLIVSERGDYKLIYQSDGWHGAGRTGTGTRGVM